jgi:hypothetical protein
MQWHSHGLSDLLVLPQRFNRGYVRRGKQPRVCIIGGQDLLVFYISVALRTGSASSFSSVQHQLHALYMAPPLDSTYAIWLVSLFPRDNTLRHGRSSDLDLLCCLSDMLSVKWTVRKSTLDIFLGRTLARFLPACVASRSFESSPSETPSIELRR